MDLALGLLDRRVKYSLPVLDVIYKCTLCGACDTMCKRNIDLEILEVLKGLREKVFKERKELKAHSSMVKSTRSHDNPWSKPKSVKTGWAKGFPVKSVKHGVNTLFYVGCLPEGKSQYRLPQLALKILAKAKIDVGLLGTEEKCCGSLAYQVGDREVSVDLIRKNIETFNEIGIQELITSCAMCYGMFKAVYPAYGKLNFKVFHIVEYVDRLIRDGLLQFSKATDLKVTYHDPCHLGRQGEPYIHWEGTRTEFGRLVPPKEFRRGTFGVYEPPRNILRSIPGVELVEMDRIKENAWCCGSGGGVKTTYEDFALWTANERLEEVKATGVNGLVTCCPHCEQNFSDAIKQSGAKIKIYDVLDLVWAGLNEMEV
jgi:Fe-S oxidoreductase